MVLVPKTHGEGKEPLPSPWFWCQKHTVKARGRCLHHGLGAKNTRRRQGVVAFTMALVPKTHGEGKGSLPSPWFWCQKHTVKARSRCLRHGCQKHTVKASGRCLHHGLGAKNTRRRQGVVAFTMVLVPRTHGEGKGSLPSPWLWCQKHTVKERARCLHRGFGAKNTR